MLLICMQKGYRLRTGAVYGVSPYGA